MTLPRSASVALLFATAFSADVSAVASFHAFAKGLIIATSLIKLQATVKDSNYGMEVVVTEPLTPLP